MDFKETAIKFAAEKLLASLILLQGEDAESSRRRWVWELIQNAYDTALGQPERTLAVTVRHTDGADGAAVRFSHDGPPFEVGHMEALVMVNSPKGEDDGDDGRTGRFGSGFITTYLLSDTVEVSGIVGGAPFALTMRRDAKAGKPALMEQIRANLADLRTITDGPPGADPTSPTPPSSFLYRLDADGQSTVRTGLSDLERCAAYLLGFNPLLRAVAVQGAPGDRTYLAESLPAPSLGSAPDVGAVGVQGYGPAVTLVTSTAPVTTADGGASLTLAVAVAPGNWSLDLPADERTHTTVVEVGADLPRLFRRFPLVGSESLRLPFVLESTHFEVTEPRNGVKLKGSGSAVDAAITKNKALLSALPALYGAVLDGGRRAGWGDLWRLLLLPEPGPVSWLDAEWYGANVLAPLRAQAAAARVVPVCGAYHTDRPLNSSASLGGNGAAVIPTGAVGDLWVLLYRTPYAYRLVHPQVLATWQTVREQFGDAEGVPKPFTPARLVEEVAALGDLASLADWLGQRDPSDIQSVEEPGENAVRSVSEDEAAEWLRALVAFLDAQPVPARALLEGTRTTTTNGLRQTVTHNAVLPDQTGAFRPKRDLSVDAGDIPDGLKDVAETLGLSVRARLLDRRVTLDLDRTLSAADLAREIEDAVSAADAERTPETERAFGALFEWILANRDDAETWFSGSFMAAIYRTLRRDADHLASYQAARKLGEIEASLKDAGFESARDLIDEYTRLKASPTKGVGSVPAVPDPVTREIAAHAVDLWVIIRAALGKGDGVLEAMASRDLGWWRERYPGLFSHVSQAAVSKYLEWLAMLGEAKRDVAAALDWNPDYDISGADWGGADDFPSVIPGVFRVVTAPAPDGDGHVEVRERIDFVVRPAHGGAVVLYWQEERALLSRPRAELWAAGGGYAARPVTLGGLADALGVNRIPIANVPVASSVTTN